MIQNQQPQYSILNVDTYRYEGQVDSLYSEKEEIWDHKKQFWIKDLQYMSNDLKIIQNEIPDADNVRIFKSIMQYTEERLTEEINQPLEEPIFAPLLENFKETLLYNSLMKTLEHLSDSILKEGVFKSLNNYQADPNMITTLLEVLRWMRGERFEQRPQQTELSLFKQLLEDFDTVHGYLLEKEVSLRAPQKSYKQYPQQRKPVQQQQTKPNLSINYKNI